MGEANVNPSRITATQDTCRLNKTPNVTPRKVAPNNTQNEPPQPSRTIQVTTDQQPQKVTQVTIPFKLIPVVPPKKGSKADIDLRIELKTRRPLSPVPYSMNRAKVTKDRQVSSNLSVPSNNQMSGPSENDHLENIDERELPVLTDNCDDVSSSQLRSRRDQRSFINK